MSPETSAPLAYWRDRAESLFFRIAATGIVPARWFERRLPPPEQRSARREDLALEIVTHCWQYSHLLRYQLSSLVRFPPRRLTATVTVFHAAEDHDTAATLAFFGDMEVPGIRWNWRALPREWLFRRAIGRNQAALATPADWVWFTDCDLLFREGCLDALAQELEGRRDSLVYPREERRTALLADDDAVLAAGRARSGIVDIDTSQFTSAYPSRATGPLQIAHGDVCRACGYCDALAHYQRPAATWRKAREDRAFRWLLRTPGVPIDVPGVYRIRHVHKGRYPADSKGRRKLRSAIRRAQSRLRDRRRQ